MTPNPKPTSQVDLDLAVLRRYRRVSEYEQRDSLEKHIQQRTLFSIEEENTFEFVTVFKSPAVAEDEEWMDLSQEARLSMDMVVALQQEARKRELTTSVDGDTWDNARAIVDRLLRHRLGEDEEKENKLTHPDLQNVENQQVVTHLLKNSTFRTRLETQFRTTPSTKQAPPPTDLTEVAHIGRVQQIMQSSARKHLEGTMRVHREQGAQEKRIVRSDDHNNSDTMMAAEVHELRGLVMQLLELNKDIREEVLSMKRGSAKEKEGKLLMDATVEEDQINESQSNMEPIMEGSQPMDDEPILLIDLSDSQ